MLYESHIDESIYFRARNIYYLQRRSLRADE